MPLHKTNNPKGYMILSYCLVIAYGLIFSCICILKYNMFGYRDWDLSVHTNILWNLVHGKVYSSLLRQSFLLDHASIIAFLVALPYFIFRHPVFLLVLQSFAISISALPVYFISRDKIDDLSGVILTALYLCYPALHYANLYEFNFEVLSLPFLSFAFYFLLTNRKTPFFLMCLFAASCKENITLTVMALGIFGLLRSNRRILGFGALLIGALYFLFDIYLLPVLAAAKHVSPEGLSGYTWLFSKYGNSPVQIISYIISHPVEIFGIITSGYVRHEFFYNVFGILFFIPLLRPDILLINVPHILIRMLSCNINEQTIYFHYTAALAPFVFFGLIFSLRTLCKCLKKISDYKYILLVLMLIFEIVRMVYIWIDRPDITQFKLYTTTKENITRQKFINDIPINSGVVASFGPLSHLANRNKVYSLHSFFGRTGRSKILPAETSYVLFDPNAGILSTFFEAKWLFDKKFLPYLLANNFGLVKARGEILLFERGRANTQKIFEIKKNTEVSSAHPIFCVNGELTLVDIESQHINDGNGIEQVTFYWRPEVIRISDYLIRIIVHKRGGPAFYADHALGYYMYPPSIWNKGDIVKENYWLILPKLAAGEYILSAFMIKRNAGKVSNEYVLCNFKL